MSTTMELVRVARIRYPLGSADGRKAKIVKITLGTIVSLMFFMIGASITGQRIMHVYAESKSDTTKLMMREYVDEAYLGWKKSNPTETCPRSLGELNPWTGLRVLASDD
jgi:hypothetical protein